MYSINYSTSGLFGQEVEPRYIPSEWDSLAYQEAVFPTAPENKKTGKGGKNWQLTQDRRDRFQEAQACLLGLVEDEDIPPNEVLMIYNFKFPDVIPYPVRDDKQHQRQIAWGKFYKGDKPASRLFSDLDRPHFYSLHTSHLGLDPKYADSSNFALGSYDSELRQAWNLAIKAAFGKAMRFWKFEDAERFHWQAVMEHDAGLMHIKRGGEVIQPVTDEEGIMAYLYKPHATNTQEHLEMWIHAKRKFGAQGKNLPKACSYYNLPKVENPKSRNRSVLSKDAEKEQYINYLDNEPMEYVEEKVDDNNLW